MKSFKTVIASAVIMMVLSACVRDEDLVARARGLKIYKSELDSAVGNTGDSVAIKNKKTSFVLTSINRQVHYLAGKSIKLHRDPDLRDFIEYYSDRMIAEDYRRKVVDVNCGFTETELMDFYRKNREKYLYKSEDTSASGKSDSLLPFKNVRTDVLADLLIENEDVDLKEYYDTLWSKEHVNRGGEPVDFDEKRVKYDYLRNFRKKANDIILARAKKRMHYEYTPYNPEVKESELKDAYEADQKKYFDVPFVLGKALRYETRSLAVKARNILKDSPEAFDKEAKKASGLIEGLKVRKYGGTEKIQGSDVDLYGRLKYLKEGTVSTVVEIKKDDGTFDYYLFKVSEIPEKKQLSFEEVKDAIKKEVKNKKSEDAPGDYVVGKIDGKEVTVDNLASLLYFAPDAQKAKYKTKSGRKELFVNFYAPIVIYSRIAKEKNYLDDNPDLRKKVEDMDKEIIGFVYKNDYFDKFYGIDRRKIKKYYEDNKEKYKVNGKPAEFSEVAGEAAADYIIPEKIMKEHYDFNKELYENKDGSYKDFSEVKQKIRKHLLGIYGNYYKRKNLEKLYKRYGVRVFDEDVEVEKAFTPNEMYEKAKQLA
ncbi:MAG: hypothetical protein ACLFQK_11640, partial [Fibrobacterota bacterium]